MKWRQFLNPIQNLSADEVRAFMDTHPEGSYTLLDVRQPKEYEKEHLPGSVLMPLPQLTERMSELDPDKPIIVY